MGAVTSAARLVLYPNFTVNCVDERTLRDRYLNAAGWAGIVERLRNGISSVPEHLIRSERIQPCAFGFRSSVGVPQDRSSEDNKSIAPSKTTRPELTWNTSIVRG